MAFRRQPENIELLRRSLGVESAFELVIGRKEGHFDPKLCDAIDTGRRELIQGFESATLLDLFLDEAPGNWRMDAGKLLG